MDNRARGNYSEALALAELTRLGLGVCIPYGNAEGFDLVVESVTGWKTVQVKTASRRSGKTVEVDPRRNPGRKSKRKSRSYEEGQFDYMVAVLPDEGMFWLLRPIDVIGRRRVRLQEEKCGDWSKLLFIEP